MLKYTKLSHFLNILNNLQGKTGKNIITQKDMNLIRKKLVLKIYTRYSPKHKIYKYLKLTYRNTLFSLKLICSCLIVDNDLDLKKLDQDSLNYVLQVKEYKLILVPIEQRDIKLCLKELKLMKYFEYIPYITYKLGGIKPIQFTETELKWILEISKEVFKIKLKRQVSFIYILYKICQLLKLDCCQQLRHVLPTRIIQSLVYNKIWRDITKQLGYQFIPT